MVTHLAKPIEPFLQPVPDDSGGSLRLAAHPFNLQMRLCCDRQQQTIVSRQYAAYPFRLSNPFRFETADLERAYLYIMNTSPGLFAGDDYRIHVQLEANTKLYLTDQSATKVHSMCTVAMPTTATPTTAMPTAAETAQVSYLLNVGAGAQLEFLPEPLILYKKSTLAQSTQVTLHPTAQLFLSELIVPGRLARQEIYQFHTFSSRLQVSSPAGELIFADAMHLEGNQNRFKQHPLFSALPVLAMIVAVVPKLNLEALSAVLDQFSVEDPSKLVTGYSRLPNCNGLLIRGISDNANTLKTYIQYALNAVRTIGGQSRLPHIPK
jgi:urease accessory protein